jgi:hypothetical protein
LIGADRDQRVEVAVLLRRRQRSLDLLDRVELAGANRTGKLGDPGGHG